MAARVREATLGADRGDRGLEAGGVRAQAAPRLGDDGLPRDDEDLLGLRHRAFGVSRREAVAGGAEPLGERSGVPDRRRRARRSMHR